MNLRFLLCFLAAAVGSYCPGFAADGAPANSELVVDETFAENDLGKAWRVGIGRWEVTDGVLRAGEVVADKHAAAARRVVETENAVYQLRFRLVEDGKAFHLGFDPAKGELDKKGHLFSVIVTPTNWKILKHLDKNRPEADPNEVLAMAKMKFEPGQWHTLRVTTWETYVTATIDDGQPLKASHPTFGVKKPTLVFRCSGDGADLDDIKVWRQTK